MASGAFLNDALAGCLILAKALKYPQLLLVMSLCCSLNAIRHFSEIIAFLSASLSTSHLFCQNYTELSFNGLMTLCINSSAFRNILKCLLLQVLLLSLSLPHNSYILKQRSSHQMRSIKKLLLKISQNSQENTYARASFLIKLLASGLQL